MEDLKEFIVWLEKYLSEGHDIINTKCVLYELKKIADNGNEAREKTLKEEEKMTTIKEQEEYQKKKQQCWEKLKRIAEEYAQKYMHPHMTIIIDQRGIEKLEGAKADRFEMLD